MAGEAEEIIRRLRNELQAGGKIDLAATEVALRAALLGRGAQMLQQALEEAAPHLSGMGQCKGTQTRDMITLLGTIRVQRPYYHGWTPQGERRGTYPLDEALGLNGRYTPGAARLITRMAAQMPFEEIGNALWESSGVRVEPRSMHRLLQRTAPAVAAAMGMLGAIPDPEEGEEQEEIPTLYLELDGTGVPMRKDALAGRVGRQADGSARTREAKLGVVFTQHEVTKDGEPVRDPKSCTYVGTTGGADEVAARLRREGLRRGIATAGEVVALGDGAAWIWERIRQIAPQAVCILDFYHASEHLQALARALDGPDEVGAESRCVRWRSALKQSRLQDVLEEARRDRPRSGVRRAAAMAEIGYFENNRSRMDYRRYREKGWFIGSGVVEAGCKSVIGSRMKQSGMFWGEAGAEAMLGLRCVYKSNLYQYCWNTAYPAPARSA